MDSKLESTSLRVLIYDMARAWNFTINRSPPTSDNANSGNSIFSISPKGINDYLGYYPNGVSTAASQINNAMQSDDNSESIPMASYTNINNVNPALSKISDGTAETSFIENAGVTDGATAALSAETAAEAAEETALTATSAETGGLGAIVAAGQMTGMMLNGYMASKAMADISNNMNSSMMAAHGYGQGAMVGSFFRGQETAESAKTALGGLLAFGAGPMGALIAQGLPNSMFSDPTVTGNIANYAQSGVTASGTSTQMQIGQDKNLDADATNPIIHQDFNDNSPSGGVSETISPGVGVAGAATGTVSSVM